MGVFNVQDANNQLRKPGRLKGRIRIDPGFEDPLPDEILAAFRGEGDLMPTAPTPAAGSTPSP